MLSKPRRGQMLRLIPLCAMLALPACVAGNPIVSTQSACSTLLPADWRQPVPGADLPTGNTVGDWIAFGDSQTAQLDKANDRTASAIGIIERCEARDKEAVRKSRPKFLGLF